MEKGGLSPTPCPVVSYRFSHFWLATVQEVLQADWQEVWHSPQPPWAALFFKVAPLSVLICFIPISLPNRDFKVLYHSVRLISTLSVFFPLAAVTASQQAGYRASA